MVRISVPAAPCRVANVLRYEWNVIFFVIPAERIHSFMGTWVQHLFRPLNTKPFFSGEYAISFRASSLMGIMSSVFVFCVMVCTHFPSLLQNQRFPPSRDKYVTESQTSQARKVGKRFLELVSCMVFRPDSTIPQHSDSPLPHLPVQSFPENHLCLP